MKAQESSRLIARGCSTEHAAKPSPWGCTGKGGTAHCPARGRQKWVCRTKHCLWNSVHCTSIAPAVILTQPCSSSARCWAVSASHLAIAKCAYPGCNATATKMWKPWFLNVVPSLFFQELLVSADALTAAKIHRVSSGKFQHPLGEQCVYVPLCAGSVYILLAGGKRSALDKKIGCTSPRHIHFLPLLRFAFPHNQPELRNASKADASDHMQVLPSHARHLSEAISF